MKNFRFVFLLLLPLALIFIVPSSALATSGACSDHGGVNLAAGPGPSGNVICNDGWTGSSVPYEDEVPVPLTPPLAGGGCHTANDYAILENQIMAASSGAPGSAGTQYLTACSNQIAAYQSAQSAYQQQLQQYNDDQLLWRQYEQAYIASANEASQPTPTPGPSINIATTSIPNGVLNQPYSATVTVNYVGSYPDVTFSNLPTGSTSSGFVQGGGIQVKLTYANVEADSGTVVAHLTGTPVVAGQYAVTMSVSEGAVNQSQDYSLNIAEPATTRQPTTTATPPSPATTVAPPTAAAPTQQATPTATQQPGKQPVKMAPLEPATNNTTAQVNTGTGTIAIHSPNQITPQPANPTAPKASPIRRFVSAVANFFKRLF